MAREIGLNWEIGGKIVYTGVGAYLAELLINAYFIEFASSVNLESSSNSGRSKAKNMW